jgi:hypothetical protein
MRKKNAIRDWIAAGLAHGQSPRAPEAVGPEKKKPLQPGHGPVKWLMGTVSI